LATLIDVVGVIVVSLDIGFGCVAGAAANGIGIVPGCGAGLLAGLVGYNTVLNPFETGLSASSFVLTGFADYLDDGELGEATRTSGTTFFTGLVMVDPYTDLVIDGYASGYNHGRFNDIDTILNGGPIIRSH